MSFIDYQAMARITDKRIVKSRQGIFTAMLILLGTKPLNRITVTELCMTAIINRKTFYSQYPTVEAAFDDLQLHIVLSYIDRLKRKNIIGYGVFDPGAFIRETHAITEEYSVEFGVLMPYIRTGNFYHILGESLASSASDYFDRHPEAENRSNYLAAIVFAVTGLLTCYLDWILLGKQFSIDILAEMAETVINQPLGEMLRR